MVENKEDVAAKAPEKEETEQEKEAAAETKPAVEEPPLNVEEFLKLKIKLSDDSEAFLFSYGPCCKESEKGRPLNCHLCRVGNLKDESKKGHIDSNIHQRNLKKEMKLKPDRYNKPYRQFYGVNDEGKLMQFEIMPGENIPEVTDEHKDRIFVKETEYVRPKADDLKVLKDEKLHEYNQKMPLLGLGYIFKMKAGEQIIYHCALCGIKIKGEAYQHIAGSTHQASYIIKHFPNLYATVTEALRDIKNEVAVEQSIRNIFRFFYRKIESNRKKPRVNIIDFEYFQKNRDVVMNRCREQPHFDENSVKFTKKEIDAVIGKALKGIEFIKPDLRSLSKPELGPRTMVPIVLPGSVRPMGREEPPQKRRRQDYGGGATPENFAAYRLMLGNQMDEINVQYKNFENNPRHHPQYDREWQLFWRERCRELKRDKIDPRYHDFESEWAPYWIQRLRQFYAKDLASRKRELKRLLNLPFDRSPSPIRQMGQQMQPEPMQWQPQPQPPRPMFGAPNVNQDRPMPIFTEDIPIVSTEPLSVISVMRLLSALEDQLGSLGPKAVQLLSRAVLCEKNTGNTDELLLDNEYYVFFATIKEKFRGQLQANLIDPGKIKAITHCGNEITAILEIMESALSKERERQRREEEKQKRQLQQQQQQQQRLQQQQQQKLQQQQQQQQKAQAQNVNTFTDNVSRDTGRTSYGAANRGNTFDESGGNFAGRSAGAGNNAPTNLDTGRGGARNRGGRKRTAGDGLASGGNTGNRNQGGGNVWIPGSNFGGSDSVRQNVSGGNDAFSRNFDGNDNSGSNFGGGNDNTGRNFGSSNDNSGRNFSGGNDSGRNFGGGNDSGRNFGGGNDSGRSFGGGNNSGRNFGGGNDSGRSFGGGNDSGRNFGGGNNSGRNFGGGNDSGRSFGGGNDSGRNFSSGGGNDNRNFSSGGGGTGGRNFGTSNFGSRNDSGNFGTGSNFSSSFDNKTDNFNKSSGGTGGGNDRWGNFASSNDMGTNRNFSGGNNDNFNRGGGGGNKDNFGKSFGGGGNSNFSSGNASGGNTGRNFGGSNLNRGGGGGGNYGNMNTSGGGNNSRELDLYSRRDEGNLGGGGGGGRNFGGNSGSNLGGGGGNYGLGQSSNFGRLMGFNSKF